MTTKFTKARVVTGQYQLVHFFTTQFVYGIVYRFRITHFIYFKMSLSGEFTEPTFALILTSLL